MIISWKARNYCLLLLLLLLLPKKPVKRKTKREKPPAKRKRTEAEQTVKPSAKKVKTQRVNTNPIAKMRWENFTPTKTKNQEI